MEKIKTEADGGGDFAQLARDFSESATSGAGGDLGWIARGQLDQQQVDAIFAAPIGKTSEIVDVTDDGLYLYKVFEEQDRTPRAASSTTSARTRSATGMPARRRRSSSIGARGASRAVLDALVAEARLRWRLDLAAGLQIVAAERVIATPSRHPGRCCSCRWRRFARRTTEALSSHSPAGMDRRT
jgi:hypothetical protein